MFWIEWTTAVRAQRTAGSNELARSAHESDDLAPLEMDAGDYVAAPEHRGTASVLCVDLYDHEAASPVLDSSRFYRDCAALLADDGVMAVNLFGRDASFETSAAFDELERLVLRYATAMTATPVEVPDELFAGLRRHLDDRQLVELTSAIAWENYRARFDHAVGIESEGFVEGALCALPARAGH